MHPGLQTVEAAELVAISTGHPMIRHLVPHLPPSTPGWSYGRAVALVNGYWHTSPEGDQIIVVGPSDDAAHLAERLAAEQPRPLSIPAEAFDLLPVGLLTNPHPWQFRWVDASVDLPAGEGSWLDPAADAEVAELLDGAFPGASFRPGSERIRAWAGVRDSSGRLIACAADTTEAPGVGFVAAITVRRDLRGQGIGRELTAWTLNRLVEREGLAALWLDGDNLAAAAVYDTLDMRRLPLVWAERLSQ